MSAKKSAPRTPSATPVVPAPAAASATGAAAATAGEVSTPWIESTDPRRRMIGKIALVAIWIYVAALWLLALDQWFNWGIFGPKIPPLP